MKCRGNSRLESNREGKVPAVHTRAKTKAGTALRAMKRKWKAENVARAMMFGVTSGSPIWGGGWGIGGLCGFGVWGLGCRV